MHPLLFTDGSSLGNPGPGGFGAIIKYDGNKVIVKGGADDTTNNRMEMSAVIAGLAWIHKHLPEARACTVYSDSSLVIDTLNKGWKRKKNLDLWKKLDHIRAQFDSVTWQWIRGHNGHKENTEADRVAVQESTKRQKALASGKKKAPRVQAVSTSPQAELFDAE